VMSSGVVARTAGCCAASDVGLTLSITGDTTTSFGDGSRLRLGKPRAIRKRPKPSIQPSRGHEVPHGAMNAERPACCVAFATERATASGPLGGSSIESEQLLDHLLALVHNAHGPADAGVKVLVVVDAQRFADGGHEIDGAYAAFLHTAAFLVGPADR